MASTNLQELFAEATRRCGQSYETAMLFFRQNVERELRHVPVDQHKLILSQARELGYCTQEEADAERDPGECIHGLDEMTCPCGCFERDDYDNKI